MMITLSIFNHDAAIDNKIFRSFWYNLSQHCRRSSARAPWQSDISLIQSILQEQDINIIDDKLVFKTQEDLVEFLLRWN